MTMLNWNLPSTGQGWIY